MDDYTDIPTQDSVSSHDLVASEGVFEGNSNSSADIEQEPVETSEDSATEVQEVVDYSDTLGEIEQLLVYGNYLVLVCAVFLIVNLGFNFGSFLFKYFKSDY